MKNPTPVLLIKRDELTVIRFICKPCKQNVCNVFVILPKVVHKSTEMIIHKDFWFFLAYNKTFLWYSSLTIRNFLSVFVRHVKHCWQNWIKKSIEIYRRTLFFNISFKRPVTVQFDYNSTSISTNATRSKTCSR